MYVYTHVVQLVSDRRQGANLLLRLFFVSADIVVVVVDIVGAKNGAVTFFCCFCSCVCLF